MHACTLHAISRMPSHHISRMHALISQVEPPANAEEPPEGLREHDLRYLTVRPHVEL